MLSVVLACAGATDPPLNIATATYLSDYPDARCLDGTPAFYYMRKATSARNASKFVIHIQGGGWCDSMESCYQRSFTNLGSSDTSKTGENTTIDLNQVHGCENNRWCGALMVNDKSINAYAHDWNAVLLRYCDGASLIGNMKDPVKYNGTDLWFRGKANLDATFADLIKNHGLGQATEVLIGGDSAGGLATFLHIDTMADFIHSANAEANAPKATVLGMPDSGFWPDDTNEGFSDTFRSMFKMQNGKAGLPKHCKYKESNISRCLFPQYFADEIETTLFPLQSLYDPLQKGSDPQSHGEWMMSEMNRSIFSKPSNGGWVHSCERHCGAELLTIGNDGSQVPYAVQEFLHSETRRKLYLQDKAYPCTTCCNDGQGTLDSQPAHTH